jgi:hypothetical protein
MTLTVLASGWLFASPMLWAHRAEQAVLSLMVGVVGLVMSPLLAMESRLRVAMAAIGGVLALGLFVFPDSLATSLNTLVVAIIFMIAGLLPEVQRSVVRVRVVAAVPSSRRATA